MREKENNLSVVCSAPGLVDTEKGWGANEIGCSYENWKEYNGKLAKTASEKDK